MLGLPRDCLLNGGEPWWGERQAFGGALCFPVQPTVCRHNKAENPLMAIREGNLEMGKCLDNALNSKVASMVLYKPQATKQTALSLLR